MSDNYKFIEHTQCEYYPCHRMKEINCLFCYCPFLTLDCSSFGNPQYIETDKGTIKDCSSCTFPHKKDNYGLMMKMMKEQLFEGKPLKMDKSFKVEEN